MPSSNSNGTQLKTLERALQVLSLFTREHQEWDYTEMAEALNLHKSVVYRILVTLERHGFATREPGSSRFRLGFRFVELANIVLSGIDLRNAAHAIMVRLVRAVQETAFLTIVSGHESVCIHRVESPQPIRLTMEIGGRYPLYAGASNRVLMAYLPQHEIEAIIQEGLQQHTPNTITDPEALRASLAEIREQGYAFTIAELTPGMAALSTPIFDNTGSVVAALSISGPSDRFSPERRPFLLQQLRQAAAEISAQLYTWETPTA